MNSNRTSPNIRKSRTPSSAIDQDQTLLVETTIGDTAHFNATIVLMLSVATDIVMTFNSEGIFVSAVVENKKKKTTTQLEAVFSHWDLHRYVYSSQRESIVMKFNKEYITDRLKANKKDKLKISVRRDIQALFTAMNNGKGEEKIPSMMESATHRTHLTDSMPALPAPVASTDRDDYNNLLNCIKKMGTCDIKVKVYERGLSFVITRYGETHSTEYDVSVPSGDLLATYSVDQTFFAPAHNKVSKTCEEASTVRFYISRDDSRGHKFIVAAIRIGVSGTMYIYSRLDLA